MNAEFALSRTKHLPSIDESAVVMVEKNVPQV
jgi:hypothetical protein